MPTKIGKTKIQILAVRPKLIPFSPAGLKPLFIKALQAIPRSNTLPRPLLVVLCADKEIRQVKKRLWGRPVTTDVVSVSHGASREADEPGCEIIINTAQARRQQLWGLKQEIIFLFIHGLLHLLGHDDRTKAQRKKMLGLGEKILWRTFKKPRGA